MSLTEFWNEPLAVYVFAISLLFVSGVLLGIGAKTTQIAFTVTAFIVFVAASAIALARLLG